MLKGIGVKGDGEKRKWRGDRKQGLTPEEAATFLKRLEAGKFVGQLTRGPSNPDYLGASGGEGGSHAEGLTQVRRSAEGAKITYDVVPNKGKESAENLKLK
jgi:hypothetical protein